MEQPRNHDKAKIAEPAESSLVSSETLISKDLSYVTTNMTFEEKDISELTIHELLLERARSSALAVFTELSQGETQNVVSTNEYFRLMGLRGITISKSRWAMRAVGTEITADRELDISGVELNSPVAEIVYGPTESSGSNLGSEVTRMIVAIPTEKSVG